VPDVVAAPGVAAGPEELEAGLDVVVARDVAGAEDEDDPLA